MAVVALCMILEVGFGIIATSAASLRPLFGPWHIPQCYYNRTKTSGPTSSSSFGITGLSTQPIVLCPRRRDQWGTLTEVETGNVDTLSEKKGVYQTREYAVSSSS